MEKLNKTKYVHEVDKVEFNRKDAQDITKDKLHTIAKRYMDAVKRILDDGKLYLVELNDGYTAFGQKSRYARSIPEIGFIARTATEEKENKLGYEDYVKGLKENKIAFDGVAIPTFIDTIEDVKAKELKEKQKEAKKAEKQKVQKKVKETKEDKKPEAKQSKK